GLPSTLRMTVGWQLERPLYDETKNFTCLDGSKSIPFDQVNDDYCDCPDGTDEPGTAACPNGFFHCTNAGFRPQNIHSSLVNDGICDCCDTTDEYNSGVICENSCKELGRKEHELLAKQAEVAAEGFKLKATRKLVGLREAKKDWEIKVSKLQTFKEETEVPEKEAKEKHRQEWEGILLCSLSSPSCTLHVVAFVLVFLRKTKKPEEDREMPPYDEATQALIDGKTFSIKIMIVDLEKELSLDLGRNGEFAYMYGKCFEMTTPEYIYRICPFNKIVQKPKSGGTETSLGSWGMWVDLGSNNYSQMKYDHGTACWQGPSRSTLVKLTCGRETVVTSTVEPSRCEYAMEMQTPALCQESRLQKQHGDEWQQAHSEL
uniref:Glucosidase 2 subunit beta n=1 Tax=Eptatretus burgeri TaxID=7764 RepID=A0A8C4X0K3_EPTBU